MLTTVVADCRRQHSDKLGEIHKRALIAPKIPDDAIPLLQYAEMDQDGILDCSFYDIGPKKEGDKEIPFIEELLLIAYDIEEDSDGFHLIKVELKKDEWKICQYGTDKIFDHLDFIADLREEENSHL